MYIYNGFFQVLINLNISKQSTFVICTYINIIVKSCCTQINIPLDVLKF